MQAGLTLVELMVVVAIVAITAGVAVSTQRTMAARSTEYSRRLFVEQHALEVTNLDV